MTEIRQLTNALNDLLTQRLQLLHDALDAAWIDMVAQMAIQPELAGLTFEQKATALFEKAITPVHNIARAAMYEAARLGNDHAQGDWNGVIDEASMFTPGATALEGLLHGMRADWRLASRAARQVALRARIALDRGMPANHAIERATSNVPGAISQSFKHKNARGVSFASSDAFSMLIRHAMVQSYVDAFFMGLAHADVNQALYFHPDLDEPRRITVINDWSDSEDIEIQPNARFRLQRLEVA